jgi:DNA-binding response OmpR family regulator
MILIVDDHPDTCRPLTRLLQRLGYRVECVHNGHDALAYVAAVRPRVVVLDVMMPGMDGWEVCRVIKQHPQMGDTKVVMVTAKGGFEDKFEGMRSGADDYVVKPVDFKDLMLKVERNLAARGSKA